jgi:hypothetical protein
MATYKVIQDIEAEDKFIGPLTLKQFIFACVGILFGYLNIFALSKGAPVLMAIFLPPMALGFFLAIPWSRDQPTELWVLARMRYFLKPKRRLWDQSGIQELVTITVPKKQEKPLTKGYSEGEVKSRLKALAETIDSRGWAIKHATLEDSRLSGEELVSDRLVDPSILPNQVPEIDLESVPDVLDPSSSSLSENLDTMIKTRDSVRKDELIQKMDRARRGEPLEPKPQENIAINQSRPKRASSTNNIDEQLINKQLRAKKQAGDLVRSHMRGIPSHSQQVQPDDDQANQPYKNEGAKAKKARADKQKSPAGQKQAQAAMTSESSPDTIRLANNNDLNIATLAREADREEEGKGEVVISLH